MKLPPWLMRMMPHYRQQRARMEREAREAQVERVIEEADKASKKLVKAIDQVFVDHPDPIPYLVHVGMDYKRRTKKPGEIG